ncbi:hypothetical protein BDQ17DRAFT_1341239 [Cyathus striatus]|nr:hypothetical protein BDQ17DRAFT_1341239 [Cyathus striatus]
MRPLKHGEVGVTFIMNGGEREILQESELRLVDRTLQPGDYCKRTVDDVRSAVVTQLKVRARLQHVVTGESLDGWYTVNDVVQRSDAEVGDYVLYEDWVGQVIEAFDESVIEVQGGQLIRLPELGSRLNVGEQGSDILPSTGGGMQNLIGFLLGNRRSGLDTVIAVKHTVYAVAWLAVNQSLELHIAESRKRPQRFWYGQHIADLTLIRGKYDREMRVGDRVHLKDSSSVPCSRHGVPGDAAGFFYIQMFLVTETDTTLDILWQNGTHEQINAKDVIPYLNTDEYDCWPGNYVVWKNEDEKKPAIVQKVNAKERTATIRFPETDVTELVSVLELDPHGTSDPTTVGTLPSEGLGVRLGDYVFIHREGTTNGYEKPRVPLIGELEVWVREKGTHDGQFVGWRKIMAELGSDIAKKRCEGGYVDGIIKQVPSEDSSLWWIGEVTSLNLDGTVEVTHPDSIPKVYPLERLTRLYDGVDQLEDDLWDDELSSEDQESYPDEDQVWSMDENGEWRPEAFEDENEWYSLDEGDEFVVEVDDDVDDMVMSVDVPPPNERPVLARDTASRQSPHMAAASTPAVMTVSHESLVDENGVWKRFEVLSEAPSDHAFYSSVPSQPSKQFLSRLSREYRILESSLPPSILIRAYEDRADLLRSLIIGPENTPYEDAPFVIDWMLDSNFPNSPPIAHFHSWTNGNGRVNPNLYEEGKVCLSILGTWAGDRNETWSAARSSLLQALVSIQGLVLVKEPWFCEPAYEKLRGTEDGIVNSRLYSEKAYVLSRGFVRRALEIPLGGLDEEIKWFYYKHRRLDKVLQGARRLIEKSKSNPEISEEDQDLAVPRLTEGGIITLGRTLNKLESLLNDEDLSII